MYTVPGQTPRESGRHQKKVPTKQSRVHRGVKAVLPGKNVENRWRAARKRYRARNPERVAEYDKRYQERNRAYLLEYQKCYREERRGHLAEKNKRYRENNRERILAYQQQYRDTHREVLSEKERRRYASLGEEKRAVLKERRRRLHLVKKKRMAEKKRTAEKLKALGPLTVTIPLTDCLKSIPVTEYVKAFCNSLESVDTNVTPRESFLQLLEEEEDSHTVFDLDSGSVQVVEPPDCDDLSSLLQNISPQEWAELLEDIEESSSFDLEALVPPQGINDLLEDMSSDEGVDLLLDLVS